MTALVIKTSCILLISVLITCPLTHAQVKKSSGTHEQYEQSNESEGIGKDNSRLQTIEGKVKQPSPKSEDWHWQTRIIIDGGRRGEAFLKEDGSFSFIAPAGSYLIEVVNPDHRFEPVRVDVTAKGKIRARMVNNLQPAQVTLRPYPLRFESKERMRYFQKREEWKITDMLMNPMVMMMVLPLLLITVLPKMMGDPDTQREMQEMQRNMANTQNQMPEVSEVFANLFGGGGTTSQEKSKKKSNRIQKR